jgi:imidazolonepropionase-like amidohydrolase
MKTRILSCFLVLLAMPAAARSKPQLVVTNVTVIDMTASPPQPGMTVTIGGGRILKLAPHPPRQFPKGTDIVDGTGKFLIPAFWDMHVHVLDTDKMLPLFVANGVLGVRDLGVHDLDSILRWRAEAATGKLISPRIVTAGKVLDGVPQADASFSIPVNSPEEGRKAVRELKLKGVDCIKVYDVLSRESYFAIADEAKKAGLPFVGHVPTAITSAEASEAGQKSIEHMGKTLEDSSGSPGAIRAAQSESIPEGDYFAFTTRIGRTYDAIVATYSSEKADELFSVFRKNHTWLVPTLSIKNGRAFIDELDARGDPRAKYVAEAERNYWKPQVGFFSRYRTPSFIAAQKAYFHKELEVVAAMQRAGVRILAGTDTPNAYVIAGFSLHDELALLVTAGLTPMEALQAATRSPAEFFGELERSGTIAKGKLANLILLDANPLDDIENTTRINAVFQNGKYLSRSVLDDMLAKVEAAAGKK